MGRSLERECFAGTGANGPYRGTCRARYRRPAERVAHKLQRRAAPRIERALSRICGKDPRDNDECETERGEKQPARRYETGPKNMSRHRRGVVSRSAAKCGGVVGTS